jgi:hypothetical protein
LFPAQQTHIPDDLPSHEEGGGGPKIEKKLQLEIFIFNHQKGTSSTSKHENSVFFSIFFPSSIRIRNLNADPDPSTQINADPGSGSATLDDKLGDLTVVC